MRADYRTKPRPGYRVNYSDPLTHNLAGVWLFNEGGGVIVNDSIRGNFGTIGLTSNISWTRDPIHGGTALTCTGTASTTAGITLRTAVTLLLNVYTDLDQDDGYSIEAFVNDAGSDTYGTILTQAATRGLWVHSNKLDLVQANGADADATNAFGTNAWTHLVATGDVVSPGNHDYYYNGRLDSSIASTSGTVAFDTMFNDGNSDTFIGTISYIRLWRTKLRASQVSELYYEPFRMFTFNTTRFFFGGNTGAGPLVRGGRLVRRGILQGRLRAR